MRNFSSTRHVSYPKRTELAYRRLAQFTPEMAVLCRLERAILCYRTLALELMRIVEKEFLILRTMLFILLVFSINMGKL